MKKSFLTIITMVAMTLSANAQISIIPKLGFSIANVTYKEDGISVSPDSKIGLQLGVAAEIGVNDMFAIQPELLFIQKGYRVSSDNSVNLNYLEIPILAKVKFGSDDAKFYAIAGPSLGFAVGGSSKSNGRSFDIEFGSDKNQTKRTDLGFQFGAGVNIKNFVIDVRYGVGLSNLSNDNDGTLKNKAIGITVGYSFPFGGK